MRIATLVFLVFSQFYLQISGVAAQSRSPSFVATADSPRAGKPLVAGIQTLLAQAGYAPGPSDGELGARTVAAIRAFQTRAGMPVDGKPSPALYRRLAEYLTRVTPAARGPADAAPSPLSRAARGGAGHYSGPILLIGTTWRFMDASGASFEARFENDGTFEGPGDARFWSWELTPGGLRIVFDDGMGTQVVRDGRFVDGNWLNGVASSGDRQWDWIANRITQQSAR